ncbi:hypothetical protein RWE15_17100 [Virgibacillus halophilus]|uniref:Uncharacterized protein n=1 Tax=Tigheibacillus halophilus TaxID=361280 RepID=A0ABU5C8Z0_9BACI|nr:hypothetical protein [Virgibacillus halophilus]
MRITMKLKKCNMKNMPITDDTDVNNEACSILCNALNANAA